MKAAILAGELGTHISENCHLSIGHIVNLFFLIKPVNPLVAVAEGHVTRKHFAKKLELPFNLIEPAIASRLPDLRIKGYGE